jgi:hypothetical protein
MSAYYLPTYLYMIRLLYPSKHIHTIRFDKKNHSTQNCGRKAKWTSYRKKLE